MKIVILAGGFGTRISEYTKTIPKPMIKISGYPIIMHLMRHYLKYDFKKFIIATGYKGEVFNKYFKSYKKNGLPFRQKIFGKNCELTIVNTGLKTLTGGRIKRLKSFLNNDENFMFTYGDGLSDVNLRLLLRFHKKHKKMLTVTAVRPPARFGELKMNKSIVTNFKEKPQVTSGWINGGFFIAKNKFLKTIKSDKTILEKAPLENAAKKRELMAFKHYGFWKCMDTKRDKEVLEKILKKKR